MLTSSDRVLVLPLPLARTAGVRRRGNPSAPCHPFDLPGLRSCGAGADPSQRSTSERPCFCPAGERGGEGAASFPRGAPPELPRGRPSAAAHPVRTAAPALRAFRASAASSAVRYDEGTVGRGAWRVIFSVCPLLQFQQSLCRGTAGAARSPCAEPGRRVSRRRAGPWVASRARCSCRRSLNRRGHTPGAVADRTSSPPRRFRGPAGHRCEGQTDP